MAAKESAEDRKLRLEAELLELDLAERKADAALRKAERARSIAEAKQNKAEAEFRLWFAENDHNRMKVEQLASDYRHERREYTFDTEVTGSSVAKLIERLKWWESKDVAEDNKRPILVKLKSPGGSVIDGLDLFDYVLDMRQRGWTIDTMAVGIAASMAGVLLQMGQTRSITKNSTLHLHEVSSIYFGKMSEVADNVDFTKELQRKLCRIYAERSNLTERKVQNLMDRKEVFLTADEALRHGFVDEIL